MTNVVKLSDYRAAKRRAAQGPQELAGAFLLGAGLMVSIAWLEAMQAQSELFLVPWPGGVDDLPV